MAGESSYTSLARLLFGVMQHKSCKLDMFLNADTCMAGVFPGTSSRIKV